MILPKSIYGIIGGFHRGAFNTGFSGWSESQLLTRQMIMKATGLGLKSEEESHGETIVNPDVDLEIWPPIEAEVRVLGRVPADKAVRLSEKSARVIS